MKVKNVPPWVSAEIGNDVTTSNRASDSCNGSCYGGGMLMIGAWRSTKCIGMVEDSLFSQTSDSSNLFVWKTFRVALFLVFFFTREILVRAKWLPAAGTIDGKVTDQIQGFLVTHVGVVLFTTSLRLSSDSVVPVDDATVVKDVTAIWIRRIRDFFACFKGTQANCTPIRDLTSAWKRSVTRNWDRDRLFVVEFEGQQIVRVFAVGAIFSHRRRSLNIGSNIVGFVGINGIVRSAFRWCEGCLALLLVIGFDLLLFFVWWLCIIGTLALLSFVNIRVFQLLQMRDEEQGKNETCEITSPWRSMVVANPFQHNNQNGDYILHVTYKQTNDRAHNLQLCIAPVNRKDIVA